MSSQEGSLEPGTAPWEFAGWGTAERITDLDVSAGPPPSHGKKLGTWASTAICGNDITSSCLYVSALCASQAGALAPVALIIVALAIKVLGLLPQSLDDSYADPHHKAE